MPQIAEEIRTAANGSIWVAPEGTTPPVDEFEPYIGFFDLGFTTEDGVKFKDGKTTRDQTAWQSFYPVGKKVTARSSMATGVLKQWNAHTLSFTYGGGTVTAVSAGHYRFDPPDPEHVDYRAFGIDWEEGELKYRLIIPRGMIASDAETQLARTTDMDLPFEFDALPSGPGVKPWYLLTNDPAIA